MKKRELIIGIILVLFLALFITFIYPEKCKDRICFNKALEKCRKASFIDDGEKASWKYIILGYEKDECKVKVELLQMKKGDNELVDIEKKSRNCYLPYGYTGLPQDSLDRCHGLLKEELQKIIISRLHKYIADNLGEISEEMKISVRAMSEAN